jgi:hypothetical protein
MEPGAHISAKENKLKHNKTDFEVPLVADDFSPLLPQGKMPPASKSCPSSTSSTRTCRSRGSRRPEPSSGRTSRPQLRHQCKELVAVDTITGLPTNCTAF